MQLNYIVDVFKVTRLWLWLSRKSWDQSLAVFNGWRRNQGLKLFQWWVWRLTELLRQPSYPPVGGSVMSVNVVPMPTQCTGRPQEGSNPRTKQCCYGIAPWLCWMPCSSYPLMDKGNSAQSTRQKLASECPNHSGSLSQCGLSQKLWRSCILSIQFSLPKISALV